MEIIAQLGSLLGLSFISGINLYATVAVVGICSKFNLVQGLPPELSTLGNDAVIVVALLLYAVEFLVDKVPGLDSLWDSIHTLIRPLGGAMLALMQVGEASPALEVIVFMLGASLASAAHMAKAGTRLIVNTSPEPFSNIVISTGEDLAAIGFSYLTLAHPTLSFFLTLACLALIAFLMPLTFRIVRMLLGAMLFKMKYFVRSDAVEASLRSMPMHYDLFFDKHKEPDEKIFWTGRGYAVRVPGVSKYAPVQVVISSKAVHLLYKRRFRINEKVLALDEIRERKHYSGFLMTRWLLRSSKGDWLIYLYQPLYASVPQDLTPLERVNEKAV